MIISKRRVQVGDNIFVDVEEHPKTEMPEYYPGRTDLWSDGTLALFDCHSKHYTPTPEAQANLAKKIKSAKSWVYIVREHERCA